MTLSLKMSTSSFFFLHDPSYINTVPCAWSRKTAPEHNAPSTMFNSRNIFFMKVSLYPHRTKATCIFPNSSSCVSSDQTTDFLNPLPCFRLLQGNFSQALKCRCVSSRVFHVDNLKAHHHEEPSQSSFKHQIQFKTNHFQRSSDSGCYF